LLLAAVWVFLLVYSPTVRLIVPGSTDPTWCFFPNRSNLLHVSLRRAAAVLAFLLVFRLLGGWILAGRMLRSLPGSPTPRHGCDGRSPHRIVGRPQDEFRELADAFDTMLARLEAHVAEQQRFAANASHELRTPLAITQTLLDVARNDPNRDNGDSSTPPRVNTRAIDLTEALLLLSRADHGPSPENTSTCPS
jgi:two-component system sensor histidine kinase VanS